MPPPSRPRPRVVWSAAERIAIVKAAADIQSANPDLSGLPLIRVAVQSLPESRRRNIVTLSQVAWFEPGLILASRAKLSQSPSQLDEWRDQWRADVRDELKAIRSLLETITLKITDP